VGIAGVIIWRCVKTTEDERLVRKLIITAVLLPIIAFSVLTGILGAILAPAFGVVLAILWAPNLGELLVKPLTNALDGGGAPMEAVPFYSIAEARRKQGRYEEAVEEVEKQLAKFPTDFPGWLLLAQIQAEDLKDLAAARTTIERILNQAGHAPKNLAHALNRLADWQLKFGQDIEGARECFERIIERFPDSELAQLAAQRLAHLTNPESILKPQEARRIHVPHHEESIGLRDDFTGLQAPTEDSAVLAAGYVKHLESHPLDYEAREKLALLYVEHYQRLDLAADQLEQLIAYPHQPAKQVVHWLNLLADLYIKCRGDVGSARKTLQRILDKYPNDAAAENARHRMALLNLELKGTQQNQPVKLGSYEQNIGLKKDWPDQKKWPT
jgi:tetratricopeptide (TPR) repeat protein